MLAAKDMDKTVKGLEDLCAPSKRLFVVSVAKKVTEFSLDQSKRSMEELDSVLKELWRSQTKKLEEPCLFRKAMGQTR